MAEVIEKAIKELAKYGNKKLISQLEEVRFFLVEQSGIEIVDLPTIRKQHSKYEKILREVPQAFRELTPKYYPVKLNSDKNAK